MGTKVIRSLAALGPQHKGVVLTLGNFDGVHIGHQKILAKVCKEAAILDAPTMALTFDPHPVKVFAPDRAPKLLTTQKQKAALLGKYGIDYALFVPFTREFGRLSPEDFVEYVLVDMLGVRAIVVGHGYCFGKGRSGSTDRRNWRSTRS